MKKVVVVVLVLAVAALAYLAYAGAFASVKVTGQKMGPYNLMFTQQKGDYRQTGKTIMAVADALKALGVEPESAFGIYYDNPREVKKEDLRADVGMILTSAELRKAAKLRKQYKTRTLAAQDCLTAEMPFKGGVSIYLGIMKAYPALGREAEARGMRLGAIMEIYVPGKTITYVAQIRK